MVKHSVRTSGRTAGRTGAKAVPPRRGPAADFVAPVRGSPIPPAPPPAALGASDYLRPARGAGPVGLADGGAAGDGIVMVGERGLGPWDSAAERDAYHAWRSVGGITPLSASFGGPVRTGVGVEDAAPTGARPKPVADVGPTATPETPALSAQQVQDARFDVGVNQRGQALADFRAGKIDAKALGARDTGLDRALGGLGGAPRAAPGMSASGLAGLAAGPGQAPLAPGLSTGLADGGGAWNARHGGAVPTARRPGVDQVPAMLDAPPGGPAEYVLPGDTAQRMDGAMGGTGEAPYPALEAVRAATHDPRRVAARRRGMADGGRVRAQCRADGGLIRSVRDYVSRLGSAGDSADGTGTAPPAAPAVPVDAGEADAPAVDMAAVMKEIRAKNPPAQMPPGYADGGLPYDLARPAQAAVNAGDTRAWRDYVPPSARRVPVAAVPADGDNPALPASASDTALARQLRADLPQMQAEIAAIPVPRSRNIPGWTPINWDSPELKVSAPPEPVYVSAPSVLATGAAGGSGWALPLRGAFIAATGAPAAGLSTASYPILGLYPRDTASEAQEQGELKRFGAAASGRAPAPANDRAPMAASGVPGGGAVPAAPPPTLAQRIADALYPSGKAPPTVAPAADLAPVPQAPVPQAPTLADRIVTRNAAPQSTPIGNYSPAPGPRTLGERVMAARPAPTWADEPGAGDAPGTTTSAAEPSSIHLGAPLDARAYTASDKDYVTRLQAAGGSLKVGADGTFQGYAMPVNQPVTAADLARQVAAADAANPEAAKARREAVFSPANIARARVESRAPSDFGGGMTAQEAATARQLGAEQTADLAGARAYLNLAPSERTAGTEPAAVTRALARGPSAAEQYAAGIGARQMAGAAKTAEQRAEIVKEQIKAAGEAGKAERTDAAGWQRQLSASVNGGKGEGADPGLTDFALQIGNQWADYAAATGQPRPHPTEVAGAALAAGRRHLITPAAALAQVQKAGVPEAQQQAEVDKLVRQSQQAAAAAFQGIMQRGQG